MPHIGPNTAPPASATSGIGKKTILIEAYKIMKPIKLINSNELSLFTIIGKLW